MTTLRIVVFALGAVLVYCLYLPSAHPPAHFVEAARVEHDLNEAFWGADHAGLILSRALALYGRREELAPAAFASTPGVPITAVNAAVAQQMADVVERVFRNGYARGFDALVLLATYRVAALAQWLPWLAAFVLLACVDAYFVRLIRSHEFQGPSPARFALCATGAALVCVLLMLLLVMPAAIEPWVPAGVMLLLGMLIARAIRHFHP
jgi:hypothetical protein